MSYKPGDKIWCHVPQGHVLLPHKSIPGVVLQACECPKNWENDKRYNSKQWYHINLEGYPSTYAQKYWECPDPYLSPRHDPYEGDQAGDWDACPFKPELEKA